MIKNKNKYNKLLDFFIHSIHMCLCLCGLFSILGGVGGGRVVIIVGASAVLKKVN